MMVTGAGDRKQSSGSQAGGRSGPRHSGREQRVIEKDESLTVGLKFETEDKD